MRAKLFSPNMAYDVVESTSVQLSRRVPQLRALGIWAKIVHLPADSRGTWNPSLTVFTSLRSEGSLVVLVPSVPDSPTCSLATGWSAARLLQNAPALFWLFAKG